MLVSPGFHTGSVRCAEFLEVLNSFVVCWFFNDLEILVAQYRNFFFLIIVFISVGNHISSVCWSSCCIINYLIGNACFLFPVLIFW